MKCSECGIELAPETYVEVPLPAGWTRHVFHGEVVCDCCFTMVTSIVTQPGLLRAEVEWQDENMLRAMMKARMMS